MERSLRAAAKRAEDMGRVSADIAADFVTAAFFGGFLFRKFRVELC